MLRAANWAGKAINLTTTTAPHALSYKLTSLYGIPHGHAVALCMPRCWRILIERGDAQVQQRLSEIAQLVTGMEDARLSDGLALFKKLFASLGLRLTIPGKPEDIGILVSGVNGQRLSNNPVQLASDEIAELYQAILAI